MRLAQNLSHARLKTIKQLYMRTFPAAERKPFSIIQKKQTKGSMEILSIENDTGDFLGLAITILYNDIVLLDYFAVDDNRRDGGIGSAALHLLFERYSGKRFLLEIEAPDIPSENGKDRIRRKAFYLRNGMTVMPFRVDLFGVEMEILTNGTQVSFDEYHAIFTHLFTPWMAAKIKRVSQKS